MPLLPVTTSSPAPAFTSMAVKVAASKLKAGTPLTDTCSVPGAPSCRASVSLAASPVICSVPACTCAV